MASSHLYQGQRALLDEHIGYVAERVAELRHWKGQLRSPHDPYRIERDSAHSRILKELTKGNPQESLGKGSAARHVCGSHKPGRS